MLIDYFISERKGTGVDYLAPQTRGVELALAIHNIDPSQGIIITAFAYRSAGEVPRPLEALHIPILIDSSVCQLRNLLGKVEVDRAIKALTPAESLRLQMSAKFRIRGLGRAACGRNWEDLLGEALCRTLIGAGDTQNGRHWNKKVTFTQHLVWAMSSIANVWKRQFKEKCTYLMSELLVHDAEAQEHLPIDDVPSGCTPADERLIERSEEDRVFTMLQDCPDATQVVRGLVDGLTKNEIMSKYGLDEKEYAAAMRRIRTKVLRERRNGNRGGGNGN